MDKSLSSLQLPWRDALLTALAPVIWGTTYIVTSEWLPPGRPFTAALLRVLPAGLILLALAPAWPRRADWWRLGLLAALNIGAFQALLFVAAYRLPGGPAAVLGAIQPLLVMGLAWQVDGRRPLPLALLAAVAGVVGMAVLLLAPGAAWDPLGVGAALAGAASMALGTFLTRRWQLTLPLLPFTGWQLLLGGLMLAPLAALADPAWVMPAPLQWLGYAWLSLVGAVLAYGLWFRGQRRLTPVALSSLGLLSPLTAVLLGWALLGQALGLTALLGMLTVLASVLTLQLSAGR